MITLAIDTTTDRLSVAGRRSDGSTEERALPGARRHAAMLLPLLHELLGALGGALADVSALAVADGPGGFTGLRVGFATAKALRRSREGLVLWTASTLLVRAAGAGAASGRRVLVVSSALRGQLYAASYRLMLPDSVETLAEPALATVESLSSDAPDLLVADAPDELVDRLAERVTVPLIRGERSRPTAAALLDLIAVPGGAQRIPEPDSWEPHYGRPAEAQRRWEVLHGRTL